MKLNYKLLLTMGALDFNGCLEVLIVIGQRHGGCISHILLKPLDVRHVKSRLGGLEGRRLHEVQIIITGKLPREPDEGLLEVIVHLAFVNKRHNREMNA